MFNFQPFLGKLNNVNAQEISLGDGEILCNFGCKF